MSVTSDNAEHIYVDVQERHEVDGALDAAVDALSERAKTLKKGILVTRSGPGTFTVSLSAAVPYGTIHEHTSW